MTGKIVKQYILQNKLKLDRYHAEFTCYLKLIWDSTGDGEQKRIRRLLEHEIEGGARVMENKMFIACKAHIGFCTEKKEEHDRLITANS